VARGPILAPGRLHAIVSLNVGEASGIGRRSRYAASVACRNSGGADAAACQRSRAEMQ